MHIVIMVICTLNVHILTVDASDRNGPMYSKLKKWRTTNRKNGRLLYWELSGKDLKVLLETQSERKVTLHLHNMHSDDF